MDTQKRISKLNYTLNPILLTSEQKHSWYIVVDTLYGYTGSQYVDETRNVTLDNIALLVNGIVPAHMLPSYTYDSSPQYGSTNPVTSNGIFNANSLIKANTDSKLNLRYATVYGGYIYKIDAAGTETAITTTARSWRGICQGSDGYIYAAVLGGYIYKIDATGTETAITSTARNWLGICQGSDGYIYATVLGSYIYKIDATGTETAITTTARNWQGICQGSDGYIYANVHGGYIYKIDATGTETAITTTARYWRGICQGSDGYIYANVMGGYIYKIDATGTETAITTTITDWRGICQGSDGYIYANVFGDYIYKIDATGTETAITTTARNWHGICQASSVSIPRNNIWTYVTTSEQLLVALQSYYINNIWVANDITLALDSTSIYIRSPYGKIIDGNGKLTIVGDSVNTTCNIFGSTDPTSLDVGYMGNAVIDFKCKTEITQYFRCHESTFWFRRCTSTTISSSVLYGIWADSSTTIHYGFSDNGYVGVFPAGVSSTVIFDGCEGKQYYSDDVLALPIIEDVTLYPMPNAVYNATVTAITITLMAPMQENFTTCFGMKFYIKLAVSCGSVITVIFPDPSGTSVTAYYRCSEGSKKGYITVEQLGSGYILPLDGY